MPMQPLRRSAFRTGSLVLAALLLLAACASGPRYGAARKQSKSCECPHWNAVETTSDEVHARVPDGAQR